MRLLTAASLIGIGLGVSQQSPAQEPAAPAAPSKTVILSSTIEGVSVVTGRVAPSTGSQPTRVQLLDQDRHNLELQGGGDSVAADATGLFTANLAYPLYEGQAIRVVVLRGNERIVPADDAPDFVVRGAADWGRVRAYFAGGMILSRSTDFTNQSDMFLSFTMDKNWLWAGPSAHGLRGRVMWNTSFETMLTSLPEAQSTSPVAGTDQAAFLLSSRKAARVEAANYFPIITTNWLHQNAPNALFIAPLAKIGFSTPTGPVNGVQPAPVNGSPFYNDYGFGARLGHFKMSRTPDAAPELISFLDVVAGRFSNLETIAPMLRLYRISVQGTLKVPSTPLVIGFSANIGQNLLQENHFAAAGDDLRFFFGVRLDAGRLLAQFIQLRKQ